jgi:hypothetical protein
MLGRKNEQELWRAVLDDPDSVPARIAFARRVGGARGEFMLAQIEASDLMRAGRDGWWKPSIRADKLLKGHERDWGGPIVDAVPRTSFMRGCVELIEIEAARFIREWRDLYAQAPIRHLDLVAAADVADALFDCEGLERIVGLSFNFAGTRACRPLGDAAGLALARSQRLRRLRYLDVRHCGLSENVLAAIARSPNLQSLEVGLLDGNAIRDLCEDVCQDWDGTITDVRPGTGLYEFEQRYGRREWLHPRERRRGGQVYREEF